MVRNIALMIPSIIRGNQAAMLSIMQAMCQHFRAPVLTTGKRIAIVGGGPGICCCIISAAMGLSDSRLLEKRKSGIGMLRYGIAQLPKPRALRLDEGNRP